MFKIKGVITLFLAFVFSGCNGQQSKFLQEKSSIQNNQSKALLELIRVADIIDGDAESIWAYEKADSILSTIDISGKNYHRDLSKIYSATSHIFYGMSYTRAILAVSRGEKYSLAELTKSIVDPINELDYKALATNELLALYSVINFYKVSGMPRYGEMYALFQKDSLEMEIAFNNYSPETAYRIVSLENKKLFFMIFVGMIVDIYSVNNQHVNESEFNDYIQTLINLGEEMDKIPSSYDAISIMDDQEYHNYILASSEIQKAMLELLATEIGLLK